MPANSALREDVAKLKRANAASTQRIAELELKIAELNLELETYKKETEDTVFVNKKEVEKEIVNKKEVDIVNKLEKDKEKVEKEEETTKLVSSSSSCPESDSDSDSDTVAGKKFLSQIKNKNKGRWFW